MLNVYVIHHTCAITNSKKNCSLRWNYSLFDRNKQIPGFIISATLPAILWLTRKSLLFKPTVKITKFRHPIINTFSKSRNVRTIMHDSSKTENQPETIYDLLFRMNLFIIYFAVCLTILSNGFPSVSLHFQNTYFIFAVWQFPDRINHFILPILFFIPNTTR